MRRYRLYQLLTSRAGIVLLVVLVLYAIASFFVDARTMVEVGDAFSIPMCAAAFWVYGKFLLERSRRPPDYVDLLILGVCGGWLINFLDRSLRLMARLYDVTLSDSRVLSLLLILLTYFAALHVLVRGSTSNQEGAVHLLDEGWWGIVIALAAGVVLAAVVFWLHVN